MARYKKISYGTKKTEIIKPSGNPREDVENFALVALRRRYLVEVKTEEDLEHRLVRFNNTLKKKDVKDIIKIVKYYLRIAD